MCKSKFAHRTKKRLFTYSNNGITIASIMDDRRAMIDNSYPIKIRVTHKRVRKYYATGKNLSAECTAGHFALL